MREKVTLSSEYDMVTGVTVVSEEECILRQEIWRERRGLDCDDDGEEEPVEMKRNLVGGKVLYRRWEVIWCES